MENKPIVIGIAGYARCGKDTFVGIAKDILSTNGYIPLRIAFADNLKHEVQTMLNDNNFSAVVHTDDSEAKSLIRPLMVWWGCQRRKESENGSYWIKSAKETIDDSIKCIQDDIHKVVILISDCRFENEAKWIQEDLGGTVIHLKRYKIEKTQRGLYQNYPENEERVYDSAPNDEELKQDPKVVAIVNHRIEWENKGNLTIELATKNEYLRNIVLKTLNRTEVFNGKLSL